MTVLQVGNVVECVPLMGNMTKENVVLTVEGYHDEETLFGVYYFGIRMGQVVKSKEELSNESK